MGGQLRGSDSAVGLKEANTDCLWVGGGCMWQGTAGGS